MHGAYFKAHRAKGHIHAGLLGHYSVPGIFWGAYRARKPVVMVAGTNGKTTVCNLTEDILTDNHVEYVCNRFGANVNTGIASALIADSTFFGNPKHDLAVFEFDERSAEKILSYIQPDYFVCTNLCRDALDRNANVEFIADLLNKNLNDSATLILNRAMTSSQAT